MSQYEITAEDGSTMPPFSSFSPLTANQNAQPDVYQALSALPLEAQKALLVKTLGTMSVQDQGEVAKDAGVRKLSPATFDFVWRVVIIGTVVIFLGASAALITSVFMKVDASPLTAMFTALIAFIGGLLAPSPVQASTNTPSTTPKSSAQ